MSKELPELPYYCAIPGHEINYHHDGDAGLDLPIWDSRLEDGTLSYYGSIKLPPGGSITLETGIQLAIPEDNFGFLDSRSGTSKKKLDLLCRIIDNPYRGVIKLAIINLSDEDVEISNKDELFQIVIMPYTKVKTLGMASYFDFLEYAGHTERGSDGFGSKERNQKEES